MKQHNMPTLLILAGGLATRLYPLTKTISKSMIEIIDRPFIAYQFELFKKNQLNKIIICVGNLAEQIEEFVGDGSKFGLEVSYSFDGDELLGTGGSIKKSLPLIAEDSFFVTYGDSYLDVSYQNIWQNFQNAEQEALMTVIKNADKWDSSNVEFRDGKIINYNKINKTAQMLHIDYGLSIFNKEHFSSVKEYKFDLAVVQQKLVAEQQLLGYEVQQRFYEIGSEQGIKEFTDYISKR